MLEAQTNEPVRSSRGPSWSAIAFVIVVGLFVLAMLAMNADRSIVAGFIGAAQYVSRL